MERTEEIKTAYLKLLDNIAMAAKKNGRTPDAVKLVAVTKNFPVEDIDVINKLGQIDVGENRVQEMLKKQEYFTAVPNNFKWHMIGTLQKNKVRQIVGRVALIHSVDSEELLSEINKRAAEKNVKQKVLLQLNISREASKHGFTEMADLAPVLSRRCDYPQVLLCGIMTMAPFTENYQEVREVFRRAHEIQVELSQKYGLSDFHELSMGMTHDYEIAVAEGATIIRVGSAIFGARNYNV